MTTVGRNAPCPCGSGKKFKHCCGAAARPSEDAAYDRIRRLDGDSALLLAKFAKRKRGEHALHEAQEEFLPPRYPSGDAAVESGFFERWFLFDWRPTGEERLAEMFLRERGSLLDADTRAFLRATMEAPYSFFQTVDVQPGSGLVLRDLLREREFHVKEKSASAILVKSCILYGRVVELDGLALFMGTGARTIDPGFLPDLLDLRRDLQSGQGNRGGTVTAATLLEHEEELREIYFAMHAEAARWKPRVRNTDGDPLVFHTLRYAIESFDTAFEALKDLELRTSPSDPGPLVEEASDAETGNGRQASISWSKRQRRGAASQTILLATLNLTERELVVEVNSRKRATRVQKEIVKRLGKQATLTATEVMTEEEMEAHLARGGGPVSGSERDRLMRESPEAQAMVREYFAQHWKTWPDVPLPALQGKTPRQAAGDPIGRELLESLLLQFEARNDANGDEFQRVDTDGLRRELGLAPTRT
jgi:hypothetical protein